MTPRYVIAGTGRAGTTAIVQLLTALGVDTGFSDVRDRYRQDVRAGMETHVPDDPAAWDGLPLVVKDPRLSLRLGALVRAGFCVARAFVPIRELGQAAGSRVASSLAWIPDARDPERLLSPRPDLGADALVAQERALAEILGRLVVDLELCGVPYTFLHYPADVHDPVRLYRLLSPLGGDSYSRFEAVHASVIDPDLGRTYAHR